MKNISHIIVDGNLTADPELKNVSNGKNVTTFSIAVNHGFKNKEGEEEVSFLDIEAWDKMAENCAEYLAKGRKVTVMGTLRQDRWKNADGSSRSKVKVVANSIRFDSTNQGKEKKAA